MEAIDYAQIRALAVQTVQAVGVENMFPTPLDEIQRHLRLGTAAELDFSGSDVPAELRMRMQKLRGKVFGALDPRERVVYVDPSLPPGRRRFTMAHELGHGAIPWQSSAYAIDDQRTLSGEIRRRFELEANAFASDLLFGTDYIPNCASYADISFAEPRRLSTIFGTSVQATARRFIEEHPHPCALLVFQQRWEYAAGKRVVRLLSWAESASFRSQHGPVIKAMRLCRTIAERDHELAALVHTAVAGTLIGPVRGTFIAGVTGDCFDLEVLAFNKGNPLAMVIPRGPSRGLLTT